MIFTPRLNKNLLFISLVLTSFLFSFNLKSQYLSKSLCEKFHSTNELYLISSELTTKEYSTNDDEIFTLLDVLQENWPEKNIILISEPEYLNLDNVTERFHLDIKGINLTYDNTPTGTKNVLSLKKGKVKFKKGTPLYWMNINVSDLKRDFLSERLIYVIENLKYILDNYKGEREWTKDDYKTVDFEDYLKTYTLYLLEDNLYEEFDTYEAIKEEYPYDFKIVSKEEWQDAILNKEKNVLYIEHFGTLSLRMMEIFSAKDGKMIYSTKWLRYFAVPYGDKFYKRLVK